MYVSQKLGSHQLNFSSSWIQKQTIFPCLLAVRFGHITELGPVVCQWRGSTPFQGLTHKNLLHESFILLPLRARTSTWGPHDANPWSLSPSITAWDACLLEHLFETTRTRKALLTGLSLRFGDLSIKAAEVTDSGFTGQVTKVLEVELVKF